MCTGAALLYGIPRIVIGENETFMGAEAYLSRGVELVRANDPQCVEMMTEFIAAGRTLERGHRRCAPAAFSRARLRRPRPEHRR